MKISVSYDSEMIKRLILADLDSKIKNNNISGNDIIIKVKSNQNYRVNEWEIGQLKCDLEVKI